jgi:hypothetical protein
MISETRLDIAKQLASEAEGVFARQQELVAVLESNGSRTQLAARLLKNLEDALANFRRTLAELQSMQPSVQLDERQGMDRYFTDAVNGRRANASVKTSQIAANR